MRERERDTAEGAGLGHRNEERTRESPQRELPTERDKMRYQGREEVFGEGRVRLGMMEPALTARDRVGVQDFVMLENYTSEATFIENLRRRFKENLVYTYIGSVLVSVNPYKDMEIYSKQHMERYRGVPFYQISPHIYALSDNTYRSLRSERRDQCILISGESGAGKTEVSKKILLYYGNVCPSASDDKASLGNLLLQSTPVLESFGNAKTLRNDNSSRFGKYMDIQFDFRGVAVGGHVVKYLLEKSRVVHQGLGERNFHIFYQLLEGGDEDLLKTLGLERNPHNYHYLVKGNCPRVGSISDKRGWGAVMKALPTIGLSMDEVQDLLNVVAAVLHLGNTQFGEGEDRGAQITTETRMKTVAKLLGVDESSLSQALTHQKLTVDGEEVIVPLDFEQAGSARDAFAKSVYGRAFTWLVERINQSLAPKGDVCNKSSSVIGLLDFYGFEVFQHNSLEQFCINYSNEKLQQVFIELTFKSEQEDYESNGIAWETVPYFDNKIICDLIEGRENGIISILEKECLIRGKAGDNSFLAKLEDTQEGHTQLVTQKSTNGKTRKVSKEEFKLLHYAGEVNYSISGFLDKNNNFLCRNVKEVMRKSDNPIIKQCFYKEEMADQISPETLMVATKFRNNLGRLLEMLACKQLSYVRCVRPNNAKQSGGFEEALVRRQVKALGLVETVRVRRAGFAYRGDHDAFLQRYKPLCPATWPIWRGSPVDGVTTLADHLGYKPEEYKLGSDKIFIRCHKTLFATNEALEAKKPAIALKLQTSWRGYRDRARYQRIKTAAVVIQSAWRGMKGRRIAKRRRQAADIIRSFIQGFIYRHHESCPENEYFLTHVRYSFLKKVRKNLPTTVLDKTWPVSPPLVTEVSRYLWALNMQNMVQQYCGRIQPEWKKQLEQKLVASEMFKDQKESYPESVARLFVARLENEQINLKVSQILGSDRVKYGVSVTKYDRRGFKPRPRQLLLTASFAVLVDRTKIKQRIDYETLRGISVSSLSDGMFVVHVPSGDTKQKADVVLQCDHAIEVVTTLAMMAGKISYVNVSPGSIRFTLARGKEGAIDFVSGSKLTVVKARGKKGHLLVTVPPVNAT